MSEYWVSKKQYWCKYCDIFIRDDAPSRRLHEAGLKHQGSKERFIRDLYKTGNQAKREKEEQAKEMARIEANAARAYANDIGSSHSVFHAPRLHESAYAKPARAPVDKFANYSTAEQLGFAQADTAETSYAIEKAIAARPAVAGKWEEVDAAREAARYVPQAARYVDEDQAAAESWTLRAKRARDPYDEDAYDPKKAIARIRVKDKTGLPQVPVDLDEVEGALKREGWSGKIEVDLGGHELGAGDGGAGEVGVDSTAEDVKDPAGPEDVKPASPELQTGGKLGPVAEADESKPDVKEEDAAGGGEGASSSLFKKRRPPPGGRKK